MADFVKGLLDEVDETAEGLDELLRTFRHVCCPPPRLLPPFDKLPPSPTTPFLVHITSSTAFAGKTQLLYHFAAHLASLDSHGYVLFFACKRPFDASRVAKLVDSDDKNALSRIIVYRPETLATLLQCLQDVNSLTAEFTDTAPPDAKVTAIILDDPYGYIDSTSEQYQELAQTVRAMTVKFECPIIYTSRTKLKGSRRVTGEALVELEEDSRTTHSSISFTGALVASTTIPEHRQGRDININIDGKPLGSMKISRHAIILSRDE